MLMPGYAQKALTHFQHKTPKHRQHQIMEQKCRMYKGKKNPPVGIEEKKQSVQQFLPYWVLL